MATKLFCDKCWSLRVRNDKLVEATQEMPTRAVYSVSTPTGSKQDTCSAHLLETIQDALQNVRNNYEECTVKTVH